MAYFFLTFIRLKYLVKMEYTKEKNEEVKKLIEISKAISIECDIKLKNIEKTLKGLEKYTKSLKNESNWKNSKRETN